jgi:formamidopyrimidine-DNA glycosylase
MPELPEVTTTANKLNEILPGLKIKSVWTSYNSTYFKGKKQIKDPAYFRKFKKEVVGQKFVKSYRIGKNVLLDISGPKTILVHLKMTGHLLYGDYKKVGSGAKTEWAATSPGALQDKFNGHIRLIFELSNGKFLALSDVRKFAKILLIEDGEAENFDDLKNLGPDPTLSEFNFKIFKEILLTKPNGRIKNVLMDQELIAGIGNIYSDEALWLTGIHPETAPAKISDTAMKSLLKNIKKVLKLGIDFGGDSTSDYRQPDGTPGDFQNHHNVYRRKGEKCLRRGCNGIIVRKVVGGRSAHFCGAHQKMK